MSLIDICGFFGRGSQVGIAKLPAFIAVVFLCLAVQTKEVEAAEVPGGIVIANIEGTINPATDDYIKTSLDYAHRTQARLFVVKLNTPGGLVPSTQSIVKNLMDAKVPTVVFVSPSGASATSAGVFITLSANFAVMAPATTIGAAHPVQGSGQDVQGDMRTKAENFVASFARSIAEQRGRNAEWAEKAVRDSVSITDREALEKKVIDFIAVDLDKVLAVLDGKTVSVHGENLTFEGLAEKPRIVLEMTFKQKVVNVLADPNIAVLLGLAAVLGIVMELYHPGATLPGIVGVVCLVLSLTASQVIPINYGGVGLLSLGIIFFAVEMFVPSFGLWGISGTICFVLGAIYAVDQDMVFSGSDYGIKKGLIGSVSGTVALLVIGLGYLAARHSSRPAVTGSEGMAGAVGVIKKWSWDEIAQSWMGTVLVLGELWSARLASREKGVGLKEGEKIKVIEVGEELVLDVEPFTETGNEDEKA